MNRFIARLMGLVCLSLFIAACSNPSDTAERNAALTEIAATRAEYSPQLIQEGAATYGVFCVACHGPRAEGLNRLGSNLVTSALVHEKLDAEVLDFIIKGRPASDPANQSGVTMPPRGGYPNLSNEDILSIIAYLRSLREGS